MDVTREDVLRCARLTDLHLKDEEVEPLREAMARLLTHAASLDTLNLADVPPSRHGLDLPLPVRPDRVQPSLTQAAALANAPARAEGHFQVPDVMER